MNLLIAIVVAFFTGLGSSLGGLVLPRATAPSKQSPDTQPSLTNGGGNRLFFAAGFAATVGVVLCVSLSLDLDQAPSKLQQRSTAPCDCRIRSQPSVIVIQIHQDRHNRAYGEEGIFVNLVDGQLQSMIADKPTVDGAADVDPISPPAPNRLVNSTKATAK